MPVEIKELIIRAVATEARKQDDEDGASEAEEVEAETGADPQQALVEACVRQVLTILKRSKER